MAEQVETKILQCDCGQKMKVPAKALGEKVKCVKCGEAILVSGQNTDGVATTTTAPTDADDTSSSQPSLRVGELLVEEGLITPNQLQDALDYQRKKGGMTLENLITLEYLTEQGLHEFFSKQPGMTSIELRRFAIDGELLKLIPKELALDRLVLPIDQLGKLLTVAMACPLDTGTIEEVHNLTGLKVKAMLCKMDDIHQAVQKYYPKKGEAGELSLSSFGLKALPDEVVEIEKLGDALSALEVLGARSDVIARVQDLAGNEKSSIRDIARAVGMDPILSVSLLRTANSEAYGLHGTVDSVHMAAALLGKEGTAAIVSRCVNGGTAAGVDIGFLSGRACRCARASYVLASASGRVGIGVSYTAGLLCEIGRFVLAALSPEKYKKIDTALYSGTLVEAEKKLFSHCHREAGASLAREWALPKSLEQIMLYYLTPEHAGPARDLASVISIATMVAGTEGKFEVNALPACKPALEHLGISEQAATAALNEALKSK